MLYFLAFYINASHSPDYTASPTRGIRDRTQITHPSPQGLSSVASESESRTPSPPGDSENNSIQQLSNPETFPQQDDQLLIQTEADDHGREAFRLGYDLRWKHHDDQAAFDKFKEAAEKGHIQAMREVACMALKGIGTADKKPDIETAFVWHSILAEIHNDSNSQNSLGLMFWEKLLPPEELEEYEDGDRLDKALQLFGLSEAQGNTLGKHNKGRLEQELGKTQ